MDPTAKPCSTCSGAMSLITVDPITGEEAGVRMAISGMPAAGCAEGHRRFLTPDFALRTLDALAAGGAFYEKAAKEKGLFRKHLVCAACGKDLPPEPTGKFELTRKVAVKDAAPFEARLALPKFACPGCGAEHGLPEEALGEGIMKASAAAFRSANLHPT